MKTKPINLTRLFAAMLFACVLAYVVPCRYLNDWTKVFGFPFGWFKVFHNTIGDSILSSTATDLLPYAADVILCYFVLEVIAKLYQRYRRTAFREGEQ